MDDKDQIKDLVSFAKAVSKGDFQAELNTMVTGTLGELAYYIDRTRRNLQILQPSIQESSVHVPEIAVGLSSIAKQTEDAAHTIMALVEKILSDKEGQDSALMELKDHTGPEGQRIIEGIQAVNNRNRNDLVEVITSMSFQDLTGQKLRKFEHAMEEIEKKILKLLMSFRLGAAGEGKEDVAEKLEQLQNEKLQQDLIDDILKEFAEEGGNPGA
jgi:chemotaxis protein CheZ